ncbi:MAG: hypothetical protein J5998_14145, partial [Clostridia bacterium]|nr:hypothetical protein [Clostridia bacterium]
LGLEKSWLALPQADMAFAREADAVLAPNPWRAAFPGPFAAEPLAFGELEAAMRLDAALILPDDVGAPDDAPRHVCLADDEDYALRNAWLTAEGAVHAAMSAVPFAVERAAALVIGYGRIGRHLTRLLLSLGGEATVAARRAQSLGQAQAEGAIPCPLDELAARLSRFQLIFNTAPAEVLPAHLLALVSPEALLMDVASPPYGFPLDEARRLGLRAVRENNLPGRYCPESAGGIMLDAALKAAWKGARHD